MHLASGLAVGFGGVSAGLAIGIVGDACVRAIVLEPRVRFLRCPSPAQSNKASARDPWTHFSLLKKNPRAQLFVGMVLILIFAEVLGLYGLIVSLILNSRENSDICN